MRFSASSYKEFKQCGLRFRYRKIDRLPAPEGETTHYRWFGRLVHELVYAGLGTKIDAKSYELYDKPRPDYAASLVDGIWDGEPTDEVAESILADIGEKPTDPEFAEGRIKSLRGEDRVEGWREQAKIMTNNGITALAPLHRDIVELEMVGEWNYQGKPFIGFLDIVANNEDGRLEFYDLKTSWLKPGKKLQEDFQFFIYSYALKQLHGLDYYPKGNWVHVKDGTVIPFRVRPEVEAMHEQEARRAFEYIENGVFPSIFGSPLCRFCDYFSVCYGEDTKKDAF